MKKFELRKNCIEIPWKNRQDIKEGVTLTGANQDPIIIMSYDSSTDALCALKNFESSAREFIGQHYYVKEYYVEENDYDEYGEWIAGGDVLEYARLVMPWEENE